MKLLPPNKTLEPTTVGAVSSAIAVHAASRRWLSFLRWASFSAMRISLIFILLSLMVVGCVRRDVKMREQICGSWNGGMITYFPDGSWHFTNGGVVSNITLKWESYGTWDVKDGYLIDTITNSTSENAEKAPVGRVSQFKITFLDAHNLCGTNERGGFSYNR